MSVQRNLGYTADQARERLAKSERPIPARVYDPQPRRYRWVDDPAPDEDNPIATGLAMILAIASAAAMLYLFLH